MNEDQERRDPTGDCLISWLHGRFLQLFLHGDYRAYRSQLHCRKADASARLQGYSSRQLSRTHSSYEAGYAHKR